MEISPRLTALADRVLQYRICEIVAPAGFGKSSFVYEFARRGFRVGSVCKDADGSLALMRALCDSVADEMPDLPCALPNAFRNVAAGSGSDLAFWFAQSIRGRGYQFALDDLHLLGGDDAAWRLLADLIEGSKEEGTQWILASRTWPRLPIARWIAAGEGGTSVEESDLAFSSTDVQHFTSLIGVQLTPDEASLVSVATKGWPLLSVYAARLLAQGRSIAGVLSTIKGRGIASIVDDVIGRLTPSQVGILLALALHDGVLPEELEVTHPGGARILFELTFAGVPLAQGNDRRWRLHDLLRDQITARERGLLAGEAHRIASQLEALKKYDDALRLYVRTGEFDRTRDLLERQALAFIDIGDSQLVRSALSLLPAKTIYESAQLALLRGIDEALNGQPQVAVRFLQRAAELSSGDLRAYVMARLLQCLSNWKGQGEESLAIVGELIETPQPENPAVACEVLSQLAQSLSLFGDRDGATAVIARAIDLLPCIIAPVVEARIYMRAGRVALGCSRLSEAEAFVDRAITLGEGFRLFEMLASAYRLRLVIVGIRDEAEAISCAEKAIRSAKQILHKGALYGAQASLFAFKCRGNDLQQARELSRRLQPVAVDLEGTLGSFVLLTSAQLAMIEGQYWEASQFLALAQRSRAGIDSSFLDAREILFGAQSAMLNALTGNAPAAIRSASRVLRMSDALKLDGVALGATPDIEISRILAAAIMGVHGSRSEAESVLEKLGQHASEGYRRELARWTHTALSKPSTGASTSVITHAEGLVELIRRLLANVEVQTLTPTERRVLQSLALGRSSKEIASFTGKSAKTVDNHVASILRKLQARNRGEAVARAMRSGIVRIEDEGAVRA